MDPVAAEKHLNDVRDQDWEEILACHELAQEHGLDGDIREKVPRFPVPAPEMPRASCENGRPHQQPEQTSKLLSFPPEIFEKIMAYVVGGKVVHVDSGPLLQDQHRPRCPDHNVCTLRHGPKFYTRICEAQISERSAYQEFKTGYKNIPANDFEEFYVADAHKRHRQCHPWRLRGFDCSKAIQTQYDQHWTAPFHVCRTFYESAFRQFWQNSTFSFAETTTFGRFVSALFPHQKSSIRAINMVIPRRNYVRSDEFDPRAIAGIKGLDTLNLSIHGSLVDDDSSYFEIPPEERLEVDVEIHQTEIQPLLRLQVLDIKHVNVIVYSNEYDYKFDPTQQVDEEDRFDQRYTLKECRKLSQMITFLLTQPAEKRKPLAENDRRIYEMENLLQGLKYAQNVRLCMQQKDLMTMLDD
ncbi:MAG: hypothetical protein Q9174_005693 [Haloplaca sp. 1 TL-2023]